MTDIEGDVIQLLAVDDKNLTKVIVNVGAKAGIVAGMTAYLLAPGGTRYELAISEVRATSSSCYADLSETFVSHQTAMRVVFNPSK